MEGAVIGAVVSVIVAVIGAVVSVFTLVAGKIYETKARMRNIKEEQYICFLTNLAKVQCVEGDEKKKAEEELSIKIQTMYLVGNVGMQKALTEYLKIFIDNNEYLNQEKLYGNLIQAMKIDLYGRVLGMLPKKFRSIDKIRLTVFK